MGENQGLENGDGTQGQTADYNADGTSTEGGSGHPAWQEVLDLLPSEFAPIVTPALQKWDAGVQTRFENLQSALAPWKQFQDNEIDPEFVNQALGLAAAIENEPARILAAMAEAYPDVVSAFLDEQGQGVANTGTNTGVYAEDDDDDDPFAPVNSKLAEHEQLMEQLAGAFLAEQEEREAEGLSEALGEYMDALHTAYGTFDDDFVLTQMANGADGEASVKQFQTMITNFGGSLQGPGTTAKQAPVVMGGGGGMPSNQIDPRTMSDADTRNMVAQLLKAANEE